MLGLSVNRRTRSLWTAVLATGAIGLVGLSGCYIVDDDPYGCDYDGNGYCDCYDSDSCYEECDFNYDGYCDCNDTDSCSPDPEIASVSIDEGATLEATPGEGVGVFVEYLGNGDWDVWTTCDTEFTGFSCIYDIYIAADGLSFVEALDLEGGDFVDDDIDNAHVGFDTDFDIDGVAFSTFDDQPTKIEVWLDGKQDGGFTFWVQGDEIFQGTPTNPVYFVP